ncbi:NmrA family NAD(P)-binding protein [Aromatoleum petrolei]|uniref:NAD(P)H-binding protein n=1 Tax=Aromatoleum petrolei TaxID=76116 RepID=A0ABX1MKU6_9RHOO|nr:NmrA family NAD(P)-binding protein [Aromatoleum petrolei]NMF88592.1 NAD(P)H-binding protein [Aromatoleum petrolei]QTQ34701.1 NmrA-like domain containing protein [Aromatoleum petrolei]
MPRPEPHILVTGATGAQGGAAARELLGAGFRVRILTRTPDGPAARALAGCGAGIAKGDMGDMASLIAAMEGIYGVFSVQQPDPDGSDAERRHGFALVEAARQTGVRHFVHASVCEAGRHTGFPGWESGYWYQKYWTDKWDIEEAVRNAGFLHWTVLKPAFLMDNFAQPKAQRMFPHLRAGRIVSALLPETRMQMIAADDVGAFARAAIADPMRFDRQNIDLAAETLTMFEVASVLREQLHKRVRAESVSPGDARAAGLFPGWVRSQEWTNEIGYRADISALNSYGLPLTSFRQWVVRHASEIVIDV